MKEYRSCKYYESLDDIRENPNPFEDSGDFMKGNLLVFGVIGDCSLPINTGVSLDDIRNSENSSEMIEKVSKETIDLFVKNLNNKGE